MPDGDGIVCHIRHAEEWLRWARGDCRRGDMRSAVLRLLLAEAEIRHAREAGTAAGFHSTGPGSLGARRRSWLIPVAAASALVIVAAGYALLRPELPPGPAAADAPPTPVVLRAEPTAGGLPGVVQLDSGRLLTIVSPAADPAPDRSGEAPPWGSPLLRGRTFDGPAGRFGRVGPALLGEPASLTAPADPEHLSSTF